MPAKKKKESRKENRKEKSNQKKAITFFLKGNHPTVYPCLIRLGDFVFGVVYPYSPPIDG
jgi:hypothetical protein